MSIPLSQIFTVSATLVTVQATRIDDLPKPSQCTVAFASDRDGDFEIFRLDLASQKVTQLTKNNFNDTLPVCSPDGKRIAFVSDRDGGLAVFIMDADGGNAQKIADDAGEATRISWSPDGAKLVYDVAAGRRLDVHVVNADGSGKKQLAKDAMWPAWSPDGKTIAFNRGQLPHIYLMDADGTNVRLLHKKPAPMPDLGPIWSRDGKRILYTAVAGPKPDDAGKQTLEYEIRTCAVSGDDVKSLVRLQGLALGWSDDGKLVLLYQGDRADMDLYLFDCQSKELKPIVKSPSKEMWGSWCGCGSTAPKNDD